MLVAAGLRKHFPLPGGGAVRAVDGVSFSVAKGETLGIVGESGCGKSTLARLLLHLVRPDEGELVFDGDAVGALRGITLKELRRQAQMVFQDSASSLNPRMPARDSVAFGPRVLGRGPREAAAEADEALRRVGLDPAQFGPRYPHELSGGLRQRVVIAMALACRPRLLLADEPTTALDATVQIQLLVLLRSLQRELGVGMVLVTHDLGVAAEVSGRVAVMYAGQVVEQGPVRDVLRRPAHPYTRELLASVVRADGVEAPGIPGSPPDLRRPPPGCAFAARCPAAIGACSAAVPAEQGIGAERTAQCIRVGELVAGGGGLASV